MILCNKPLTFVLFGAIRNPPTFRKPRKNFIIVSEHAPPQYTLKIYCTSSKNAYLMKMEQSFQPFLQEYIFFGIIGCIYIKYTLASDLQDDKTEISVIAVIAVIVL